MYDVVNCIIQQENIEGQLYLQIDIEKRNVNEILIQALEIKYNKKEKIILFDKGNKERIDLLYDNMYYVVFNAQKIVLNAINFELIISFLLDSINPQVYYDHIDFEEYIDGKVIGITVYIRS